MTAVELPLLQRQAYMDGKWVDADSGETLPVLNPATGAVSGAFAQGFLSFSRRRRENG